MWTVRPCEPAASSFSTCEEAGVVLGSTVALPPSVLGDAKGPGILVRASPRPPVVPSTPANLPGDPATALAVRVGETGEFKSTGFLPSVDQRTGKPAPNPSIELPADQQRTTLYVRYDDAL